jgi:hypothetical protein
MNPNRLVGSVGVRFATLLLSLLCVTGLVLYDHSFVPIGNKALLMLAVGSGILAFLGMIHAFRTVYARWLRLTRALHTVLITVLFGACYLFVVPVFSLMVWPFDPLRLRHRPKLDTFWIRRRSPGCDLASLQRMG